MIRIVLLLCGVLSVFINACGKKSGENDGVSRSKQTEQSGNNRSITFAVFGNTGLVTDNGEVFSGLIDAVNGRGVEFSVNLGNSLPDGVPPGGAGPLWDAVDKSIDRFHAPVYPVVGRTDVYDYKSDIVYSDHYGPLWYSFRKGGVLFVVLNTEDESYKVGFGTKPRVRDDQLEWLENCLKDSQADVCRILFMNRPLWRDFPLLWKDKVLPTVKKGNVNCIVTCFDNGLFDWGEVDGIRAVSSGCVGPVKSSGPGLYPHVLLVTIEKGTLVFKILTPDGGITEGIEVNTQGPDRFTKITEQFALRPLTASAAWNINETVDLRIENPFNTTLAGNLVITVFPNTSWTVTPQNQSFSLEPGVSKTMHIAVRGIPPDLGPMPSYHAVVRLDSKVLCDKDATLYVKIPKPRTGEVIHIAAQTADTIPYTFDGSPLKIPVDVESNDTCGRVIIYHKDDADAPNCIFISSLKDFRLGVNEFVWNGRDMEGHTVPPGKLTFMVAMYNKKAPVTWVAEGPYDLGGTFEIQRTLAGLTALASGEASIRSFTVGADMNTTMVKEEHTFTDFLEGYALTGYTQGEYTTLYLGTQIGIASVSISKGKAMPNASFGNGGYVRFDSYRGRTLGKPSYHNGLLYVGIGGDEVNPPSIAVIDGDTGEDKLSISLSDFYHPYREPPSLHVNDRGIFCAHPRDGLVIMMTHYGDVLWVNDEGDMIGDRDSDGLSFTYGVSIDQFGFAYVNSPGNSARCGVIGPDGTGLFRVILIQLPGLRMSSVYPMIEKKPTDGLYLVTRGGDKSYVFHVPYTIRSGVIVDRDDFAGIDHSSK